MTNPYPANFETLQGARRLTGQINFTDPANQPGGLTVLGPFTVAFNSPGLTGDGFKLVALASGTKVWQVGVVVDIGWDVVGTLQVNLGGSDFEPPDDDYTAIWSSSDMQGTGPTVAGVKAFANSTVNDLTSPVAGVQGATTSLFGVLSTAGALVASFGNAGAATGSARVWAITS